MELPKLEPWTHWSQRTEIEGCHLPGVYLLACFDDRPPRRVNPIDHRVLYIGETCASLRRRWRQFERAAFRGAPGHSGGLTFATRYCTKRASRPQPWLHVAALPIEQDEPRCSAYIRLVERWLLWRYVERHRAYPPCNRR